MEEVSKSGVLFDLGNALTDHLGVSVELGLVAPEPAGLEHAVLLGRGAGGVVVTRQIDRLLVADHVGPDSLHVEIHSSNVRLLHVTIAKI